MILSEVDEVFRLCSENKAVILDVRTCQEFSEKYTDVPKVFHIPVDELDDKWIVLPINIKLFVMNQNGNSISDVIDFLMRQEFDVEFVRGGFTEWLNHDLPIVDLRLASFCNNVCECECKKM